MRGTVVEIVCPEIRRAFGVLKTLPGVREVQLFGDRLNVVVDDPAAQIPGIEAALAGAGIAGPRRNGASRRPSKTSSSPSPNESSGGLS